MNYLYETYVVLNVVIIFQYSLASPNVNWKHMVNDLTSFEEFWAAEKWQEEFSIKVLPVSEAHNSCHNVKHIKRINFCVCHCKTYTPWTVFSLLLINEVEYRGMIGQLYLKRSNSTHSKSKLIFPLLKI